MEARPARGRRQGLAAMPLPTGNAAVSPPADDDWAPKASMARPLLAIRSDENIVKNSSVCGLRLSRGDGAIGSSDGFSRRGTRTDGG
jgi:hypothetical protein